MDKVKQFLEVARKHHFWILCGLASIICLLVLMMATGKLDAQFKTWKGEIDGQKGPLTSIVSPHPNQTWSDGMAETTAKARESVRAAWTVLYQDEADNVYKWPQSLGKSFLDDMVKVEQGKKTDLDRNLREHYQSFVEKYVKGLPKIVDSAVSEGMNAPAGGAMNKLGPDGMPIVEDHKVEWDPQSQSLIFDTFTWYERPSTTIIRQAQEELWVYEALCRVIAAVNKDASGSHDAPIRGIQEMAIAYMAQTVGAPGMMGNNAHRVLRVKQGAAMMGEGSPGGMPAAGPDGAPGVAGTPPDPKTRCKGEVAGGGARPALGAAPIDPAAAAGAGSDPDDIWKGFRYVTEDGKPLATAAEVQASPLEYDLMPFRMKLTINPKEIDSLLIEFRNSKLPLEVREVHIGASTTAGGFGGGGGGGGGMFGGGGRGRGGMDEEGFGGGGGGHRPAAPMPGGGVAGGPQQKLVQLEVSGVAYLMKKPDPAKLGITPPEGGAPVDPAAPAAPATTPPPAAMNEIQRDPIAKFEAINRKFSLCASLQTTYFKLTEGFKYRA